MRYEIPANAYPASITALAGGCLYLADLGQEDGLFYAGKTCPLPAEPAGEELFRIPMTYDTARALWKLLPAGRGAVPSMPQKASSARRSPAPLRPRTRSAAGGSPRPDRRSIHYKNTAAA